MIKLVAVLCRLAAPYDCHEQLVTTSISMAACSTVAIQGLPKWAEQFPAYELRGWTCKEGPKAQEREA